MPQLAKFKIHGLQELDKQLRELEPKLAKKVTRKALRDAAKLTAAKAKELVPVDEGDLRDSIRVKSGKSRKGTVSVIVTTSASDNIFSGEAYHGGFIEFGTSKMEAKPFLRPALEQSAAAATALIRDRLAAGIEEIAFSA